MCLVVGVWLQNRSHHARDGERRCLHQAEKSIPVFEGGRQHRQSEVGANRSWGPGGNSLDYRDSMIKAVLEPNVAVGYWDQRFGGNSQGNAGASELADYREDLLTVVKFCGRNMVRI